uniref:Inositol-tetrakisphosphate 1-kinase n=1 Tax=Globisporangium ultimum (strain ATCC 200006 / CBS 805.95 / DAOM BR144) TaxID=431595 RepID=K3WYF2_GLOUD
MAMTENAPLVVGVIFPAKKIDHLRDVLQETKDGVRFVLVDLYDAGVTSAQSITEKYGAFDAILHKLAHEMVFARLGDTDAAKRLDIIQKYVLQNPCVKIIDPIESVLLLTNRHAACDMLVKLQHKSANAKNDDAAGSKTDTATISFCVPKFHVIETHEQFEALCRQVDAQETKLPLICKSVEACATDRSHMMSVITQRSDLQFVEYPALYQEFINHSGRLFKGYVLGDIINVAERRSLPNIHAGATHVHFNTQKQYPTADDFHPDATDSLIATADATHRDQSEIFAAVRVIGERIREELNLSLFGFDVIVSDATQELYVIDVNYFPSYKELDDFSIVLRKHIKQRCMGP